MSLRPARMTILATAAVIAATSVAACSSGNSTSSNAGTGAGATITYWASDQGSSIADDYTVLNLRCPEASGQSVH